MTKLKENVTRRPWRDVVFIAVAVAVAPAATTISGCVRQCEDTDLCSPTPLVIQFERALVIPGTYEIALDYDGHDGVCHAVLPEPWLWDSCPPADSPVAGGRGGTSGAAGATGIARDATQPGQSWDVECSSYDFGLLFRCGIEDVAFFSFTPRTVTVTVHRDGEFVLSSTVTPEYRTYQPHKKGCGPVCREAVETIETP